MSIQKEDQPTQESPVGSEFDLLLEGASDETDLLLEGRTAMHAPEIDGKVFVNDYPEGATRKRENFIAAASPRRTITIW